MKHSLKHKTFISRDGTRIGYQVIGTGKKNVVLCNGLGGTAIAWQPLYSKLSKKYTFITWDYRGLFSSAPPKDPTQMTMQNHVQDLEDLLKHKKISKPVFLVGWSMGVQIALEFYNTHKKKVGGLVLLNGTSGSPFKTALRNPFSQFILPKINELAKKVVPHLQPHIRPLAKKVINWKGFIQIVSRLGLVHPDLDTKLFRQVAHGMMNTDLTMYHEIMTHLGEHDATYMLSKISVPTLIVAGDADVLTPVETAHKMAELIPNAQFFVVTKGTHYCILEFPDRVVFRIQHFLEESYV